MRTRWVEVALFQARNPPEVTACSGRKVLTMHKKASCCAAFECRRKGTIFHACASANAVANMPEGEHACWHWANKFIICEKAHEVTNGSRGWLHAVPVTTACRLDGGGGVASRPSTFAYTSAESPSSRNSSMRFAPFRLSSSAARCEPVSLTPFRVEETTVVMVLACICFRFVNSAESWRKCFAERCWGVNWSRTKWPT